ncbi:ketoacyl-ACP synthase III [Clostridium sp. LY3-2]|uniref:beta-ketoacyl-ACP synthase III n=1 Tax=Clostridium sp. LY3-2 TaxID=2942482 RepID=UPI002153A009|nr:beta-ketoacyl-ACP synthase III [Clostridium sp. LY3-2]MCR6515475.1 ketoacyl-ACP synthase III [Clostridium sp. LY3-2]
MKEVKISSIGAYLPPKIVTNNDLSELVETNDQWIVERTGISERRVSTGENTSNIALEASKIALERANVKGEDIDLIIVATITPDSFTPSVACMVQKEIGAKKATAFDINAACTGFIYALEVCMGLLKSGKYNKALVVGAETLSKIVDWTDRRTCILFGDGGGACVVEAIASDEKGIINTFTISDGEKGDALVSKAIDVINPFVKDKEIKNKYIQMNGQEVFKFATRAMVDSIINVLKDTGVDISDIKYVIPHQANVRIIEYAAKKLNLDKEKFYINLEKVGNTSSASVPIALNDCFEKGLLKKGDKIILVGFGGGLTCGSILVEW